MKATILVLAAGIGSRYGSLKQVDPVGPSGETIMDYSIYDAIRAGFGKVVFVIRPDIEAEFREVVFPKFGDRIAIDFVFQELENVPEGTLISPERKKPWGTGHAVLVAKEKVKEPFAVINADDFYSFEAYREMAGFLSKRKHLPPQAFAMVGYLLENTLSEYGSVSRGICKTDERNLLVEVTERTKIKMTEGKIAYADEKDNLKFLSPGTLVSMNFWGFTPVFFSMLEDLFKEFIEKHADNPKSEFYLSSAVDDLIKSSRASVTVLQSPARWFGVTYKEDKSIVMKQIRALTDSGKYPHSLWK